MKLLETIMTIPGYPRSSGFHAEPGRVEIIAPAEAMQAGSTIAVAKIEVISKNQRVERICAFGIATMRAVDLPAKF